MSKKWTEKENVLYEKQLIDLYIYKNLSLSEIASNLSISQSAVYDRLKRFGITTIPEKKIGYLNKRCDIKIPKKYSSDLAELFGILLGDGHISGFQLIVSLGTKEEIYAQYVQILVKKVFGGEPKISIRKGDYKKRKYRDVYLGSVELVTWLKSEGLVQNKVKSQVGVPAWIFTKKEYMNSFLRGFFDTDGSIYKLKYGIQISLTNRSIPLLIALQSMLQALEYKPSEISFYKVYLTQRADVKRFFSEIKPKNSKHVARFKEYNASVV